ncbi:YrzE family protein [Nonomuraea sp. NPDC001699]
MKKPTLQSRAPNKRERKKKEPADVTPPVPDAPRTVSLDFTAVMLGIIGAILTFSQLPPGRAWLAVVAIAFFLIGFVSVRHVKRMAWRWLSAIGSWVLAVVLLVLVQMIPLEPPNTAVASSSPSAMPEDTPYQSPSPTLTEPIPTPTPSPASSSKRKREAAVIPQADSKTFFKDGLRVGATTVFDSFADLALATDRDECSGSIHPGESLVVWDAQERWYRVVLIRLRDKTSVTVTVTQGKGPVGHAQYCG